MCKHNWNNLSSIKPPGVFRSEDISWCTECGTIRRAIHVGIDLGSPDTVKRKYIYKRPNKQHLICETKCAFREEQIRRKRISKELTRIKSGKWAAEFLSREKK